MTRLIARPVVDVCRCPGERQYRFVQQLGIFVHAVCGKPSKPYHDAAYEAGIL